MIPYTCNYIVSCYGKHLKRSFLLLINLEPVKSNVITQKHKRSGILQAAERAENGRDNPLDLKPDPKGAPNESQDEAEEGKELEQDQLDALYS
jgi:DNA repair protein RAD5